MTVRMTLLGVRILYKLILYVLRFQPKAEYLLKIHLNRTLVVFGLYDSMFFPMNRGDEQSQSFEIRSQCCIVVYKYKIIKEQIGLGPCVQLPGITSNTLHIMDKLQNPDQY